MIKKSSDPLAIILMGVSGCGKTSVGKQLSMRLDWPFYDGDDFHPPENILKMAQGVPLNDQDRKPWLLNLNKIIHQHLENGQSILLACSALKYDYRNQLVNRNPSTIFVYLKGSFDLIFARMQARPGHYMKENMLRSQFEALEEPVDALIIDTNKNLENITEEIIEYLNQRL